MKNSSNAINNPAPATIESSNTAAANSHPHNKVQSPDKAKIATDEQMHKLKEEISKLKDSLKGNLEYSEKLEMKLRQLEEENKTKSALLAQRGDFFVCCNNGKNWMGLMDCFVSC